jgi:hypothetical protein
MGINIDRPGSSVGSETHKADLGNLLTGHKPKLLLRCVQTPTAACVLATSSSNYTYKPELVMVLLRGHSYSKGFGCVVLRCFALVLRYHIISRPPVLHCTTSRRVTLRHGSVMAHTFEQFVRFTTDAGMYSMTREGIFLLRMIAMKSRTWTR